MSQQHPSEVIRRMMEELDSAPARTYRPGDVKTILNHVFQVTKNLPDPPDKSQRAEAEDATGCRAPTASARAVDRIAPTGHDAETTGDHPMTTPTDTAEIQLAESLEALLEAIWALGPETARDVLDDRLATMAEDQDTEQFEAVLVELLSEAIRTAAEVAEEDVQHIITLRSFTDGSSVQFSWGGDAGAPMSDTFRDAVLTAVHNALGLRRAQVH